QGMDQIQNILSQTGTFFKGLAPVIATGAQSFLTLANAGSNAFNLLLAPLDRFATGFDQMVNRLTASGAFNTAMQGLSVTLDSVFSLFIRRFESGVQAMGQPGGPIANLINALGDAFIAAMPGLTAFSAMIGNVGGTLLSSLAPAITAITPALTQFASMFGN